MNKFLFSVVFLLFVFKGFGQNYYFPPTNSLEWDTISPLTLHWCQPGIDSLYNYLESHKTKAFILLKDGKIVLEKYFNGHSQTSPWYWASAGKSLTASLVGIAQQEHYLSINDKTSDYIGHGWTSCDSAQENKITIRHQLTMTTGLDDGVPDYTCTLDSCLICLADPGTRWAYHNAPYTLLDSVIENATGMTLNSFISKNLTRTTGISGLFIKQDYNNVFYSTARSMARFGLLMLNKGNWAGTQVLTDTGYVSQMTHSSQTLNRSYGYLWWLNGQGSFMLPKSQFVFPGDISPAAPKDMFAALGKNGQALNVVRSQGLVWVRMGDAPDDLPVPYLMNNIIWQYIDALDCAAATHHESPVSSGLVLSPNPANDQLEIHAMKEMASVEIISTKGQRVNRYLVNNTASSLNLSDLNKGIYLIRVTFRDGSRQTRKIVKE